ncbi:MULTISPECIES: hypothetical protein [Hyphomonas]|uniref:hypothetical protein n=1 Tax=Hyphomonas TaxID=85 RepID=UPI003515C258
MNTYQWLGITARILPVGQQLAPDMLNALSEPGNYIMTKWERSNPLFHTPLYTGIARNLGQRLLGNNHEKWPRASEAGVTHVHLFSVEDERTSRDFETVLRYELQPPLQDQPRPSHHVAAKAASRIGLKDVADRAYVQDLMLLLLSRKSPTPPLPPRPQYPNALAQALFGLGR